MKKKDYKLKKTKFDDLCYLRNLFRIIYNLILIGIVIAFFLGYFFRGYEIGKWQTLIEN
jgi:hypothetical protein